MPAKNRSRACVLETLRILHLPTSCRPSLSHIVKIISLFLCLIVSIIYLRLVRRYISWTVTAAFNPHAFGDSMVRSRLT